MNSELSDFLFTNFAKESKFPCDFHVKASEIKKWNLLSREYDNWKFFKSKNSTSIKIPKNIHQIWIGSPVPKEYKSWINSWKKYNSDWEYFLWDDNELSKIKMINSDLYHSFNNFGAKSDVARLEILRLFGGIYVDTDFQCLKPLNINLLFNKMFACSLSTYSPEIGNGIIGASKNSKILLNCLNNLKNNNNKNPMPNEITHVSGPNFFTKEIFSYMNSKKFDSSEIIVLPSNYFYPVPSFFKKMEINDLNKIVANETYAIHHYESSWSDYKLHERIKIKLKNIYNKFSSKYLSN